MKNRNVKTDKNSSDINLKTKENNFEQSNKKSDDEPKSKSQIDNQNLKPNNAEPTSEQIENQAQNSILENENLNKDSLQGGSKTAKLTKKQEVVNMIKFVLFSISAGVVQIVSFTLLSELIFHDANNEYGLSYFISLVLSVIWNFTFNRKFTFKSAKNVPIAMLLVFVYYCAFTPLSIWWGVELTVNVGWNNYIVLFLTMVINMATEYLWTRFVVYRDSINTAQKKQKKIKAKKQLKSQTTKNKN
ncbi:MAG: GtrA family protein [Christensenellales bacterium]